MSTSRDDHAAAAGRLRRLILWGGAACAAIAILGVAVVPAATFVWIILLIFAVTSIPQALISRPSREDERQQRTERLRRRHQPARPQSLPQKASAEQRDTIGNASRTRGGPK